MTVSSFEEITKTEPEKLADRADQEDGRPQRQRPDHDAPPGRRAQAPLPDHRLQAPQGRRAGEGGRDRVRPEPVGPDRAAPLRRRREGLHPRAGAARGRRDGRVRPRRRHPARQRAAAREHPDRHDGPQRRAEARPGRPDGSQRRLGHPARREGRRLRRPAAALGRDAPRAANLPGHRRPGRERRPREPVRRQGGPQPLAGQAPDGARLGDEPRRPPARRRRGQVEGRPPPGHARGACRRSASARAASTRNPTS